MSISFETLGSPRSNDVEQIAEVAAAGFGRANDAENYQDTFEHVGSVEHVQLARDSEHLVGFALYRRCLWRTSH